MSHHIEGVVAGTGVNVGHVAVAAAGLTLGAFTGAHLLMTWRTAMPCAADNLVISSGDSQPRPGLRTLNLEPREPPGQQQSRSLTDTVAAQQGVTAASTSKRVM